MLKDIGFWNEQGEYIPDIQEVSEVEMEEEIIIDGVDVAGCKYYLFRDKQPAGERSCGVGLIDCNGQNCTYKQLKRLEQENADLKKYIERMDKPVVEVVDADIALENAELKEKNTALEETLQTIEELKDEDSLRIAQLVTENARLKNERTADLVKQIDELKAENDRLKEEMKVLQYNIAEYSNNNIDTAVTLFAKDKAKLEKENALLKAYKNKYYQQTLDDEIKLNELYQTLQEIKSIATRAFAVCDDDCGNANRFTEILDLITKAEEE